LPSRVSSILRDSSSTSLGSISAFSTISWIYTSFCSFCSLSTPIFCESKSFYFSLYHLTFRTLYSKSEYRFSRFLTISSMSSLISDNSSWRFLICLSKFLSNCLALLWFFSFWSSSFFFWITSSSVIISSMLLSSSLRSWDSAWTSSEAFWILSSSLEISSSWFLINCMLSLVISLNYSLMSLKSVACCVSKALICAFWRSSISCISILSLSSKSCLICVRRFSHCFWASRKLSSHFSTSDLSVESIRSFSFSMPSLLFLSNDWNIPVLFLISLSYSFLDERCYSASSLSFFSVFSSRSFTANWCS